MPDLYETHIKPAIEKYSKDVEFDTFIETGTYLGHTITTMSKYFKDLYTIEISLLHYKKFNLKNKDKKIKSFLGDTSKVLPNIIPENKNIIFYLDAHWSCGNTGRGDVDCPLLEEMEFIMKKATGHIIVIIDDCDLFETNRNHDWSNISEKNILDIVKNRVIHSYRQENEYIIFLNKLDQH